MIDLFEAKDREIYIQALSALKKAKIDFMLGGAFAVYKYTNWWRNTHDIDVYVTKDFVPSAIKALDAAGFHDLGEQAKGDREWIYHACKESIIFDVIWRSANLEHYITSDWFERAPEGEFLGLNMRFLPLEELMWIKVYVINRHRCDWPDIMRIIKAQCLNINWDRLIEIINDDWLIFAALIDVFDWLYADSMGCIPVSVREEFARRRIEFQNNPQIAEREHLLDPWIHQRMDIYASGSNE